MIKIRIKWKTYVTRKQEYVTIVIRKKKNTKFYKIFGNNYGGYQGNNYENFKPLNLAAKEKDHPLPLIKILQRGNH